MIKQTGTLRCYFIDVLSDKRMILAFKMLFNLSVDLRRVWDLTKSHKQRE